MSDGVLPGSRQFLNKGNRIISARCYRGDRRYNRSSGASASNSMAKFTRRSVLTAAVGAAAAPLVAQGKRPNVLLVISDQLHHAAFGAAGNGVVQTPNIDRLAREGVRFENALCPTPFCSPTRASLMTGLYPHQHRVIKNAAAGSAGLDPSLPTTEQALLDEGYVARQFGKWHLGEKTNVPAYADDAELTYRKYFSAVGEKLGKPTDGPISRVGRPIFATEAVKTANAKYDGKGPSNTWIGRTDVPVDHTEEAWIADRAIASLRETGSKPFFMTVSFPAPHALWVINEPYYSLHDRSRIPLPENRHTVQDVDRETSPYRFGQLLGDDGMREYLGVYYGMVSMMDANLGRILDELQRLGLEKDTLVIFTADHGDMQGGHGMYDKVSYSMYEETTRVPLLLRLPGRIPAGRTLQTQAGSCDVSPTILDYLGLPESDGVAGRSLRPFIDGEEDLGRPIFAERDRAAWGEGGERHFQRLIRTLEWKYCYHSVGESQLFSLAEDPGETTNLINERSARATKRRMHSDLVGWMKQTDDPRVAEIEESV